jgi:formate hydrogenlyase transcriptional activator
MQPSEVFLRTMIDKIPILAWSCRPDGTAEFLNQRWLDYTGLSPGEAVGWGWKAAIHPEDLDKLMATWLSLLAAGESGQEEARLRRHDGEYRWFLFRAVPVRDEQGRIIRWYGTNTDIHELKRAEALLAGENQSLELMAKGNSLTAVLDGLCRLVERLSTGSLASILLLDPDGKRLWHGAAPSLPKSYTEAIDGAVIGPTAGSCGTAAYRREPVIVSDITTDPLWADYRGLASPYGFRSCWSTPIFSTDSSVLGTFAIYSREVGSPTLEHQKLIDQITHLAAVAIEHKRAEEKLRQDERELRRITDAIPEAISVLAPDGTILHANEFVLDYTGLSLEDLKADDFHARLFHPDDMARLRDERGKALARGEPFEAELRARRKDGQYRWFLVRYNPFRDENGNITRWYATGTDIEDRKQAEERVQKENLALREEIDHSSMFEEIVGSSQALRRVLTQVEKVAQVDSTVLILGETGTGKELVARAIHKRSKRSSRAFIRVNCAAIPQSLIASELFGHEKGAFTGALQRRLGRFELADGGTIFLDEIGELPADTQIALLRVLQEREIERVGGSQPISVDVRVLAATNRDLKAAVAAGTLRQDLFYRLNVFPIQMPSLRERKDDVHLLVEYFIERYGKTAGKKFSKISKNTLELFQAYDWPGNIRELQNVIERAVILCDGDTFCLDETWLKRESPQVAGPAVLFAGALLSREKEMIETALTESHGRIAGPAGAAAKLGIPRQTLESKIKRLGIDTYRFKASQAS